MQEKEIERVGGSEVIKIDVRVLAANNRDLEKMIEEGTFREDLYYRLNVIPLELPPLRERKDEIPVLVNYFISKYCKEMGRKIIKVNEEAMHIIVQYTWKGNIRELENVIERIK